MAPLLRTETVSFDCPDAVRIAFLSDLHLRKSSGKRADRIVAVTVDAEPDLIMLGGDYVESVASLPILKSMATALTDRAPVFAIAGNHDYMIGIKQIRSALEATGVRWVEKNTLEVLLKNQTIAVHGNHTTLQCGPDQTPVLCVHNPRLFGRPGASDFPLGFAGHLHGCQAVFWESNGELYPGKWFYKWNGLRFDHQNGTFLVSRGLGDTLPLRFRCPHEVVMAKFGG